MKNKWEQIDDQTIKIWLQERDGERLFTLISPEDIETVNEFRGKWFAWPNTGADSFYAVVNTYNGTTRTIIRMHRAIFKMGPYKNDRRIVDHINSLDTLDNRRSNLRIVNGQSENSQNVRPNKANSTGYRNVYYYPKNKKWAAIVGLNYGQNYLGLYDTPEEASLVAEEFRKSNMPYSSSSEVEDH